jgi:hypothetical protein
MGASETSNLRIFDKIVQTDGAAVLSAEICSSGMGAVLPQRVGIVERL